MAQKKYTELSAASALTGAEITAVVQGGVSKKTTISDIRSTTFARWDFAAEGGLHPVDLTKVYISTDDSVYPENTWFASDGLGGWYTK